MLSSNATWWNPVAIWPTAIYQQTAWQPTHQPVPANMSAYGPLQNLPAAPANNSFFAPVPSYPASNMPHMWTRLDPYISASPTLRQQLAQLANTGWVVEWNQQRGSSCELEQRRIDIDIEAPELVVMQVLAHETRHAFDPSVYMRSYANDADFAAAKMRNEATAALNHMQVRSEIVQGVGVDIGWSQPDRVYYESALRFRQWHGNDERLLQHFEHLMAWETTSMHQRPYWEVYVNYWRGSRSLPPVTVPPGTMESQRAQAWARLADEMNGR